MCMENTDLQGRNSISKGSCRTSKALLFTTDGEQTSIYPRARPWPSSSRSSRYQWLPCGSHEKVHRCRCLKSQRQPTCFGRLLRAFEISCRKTATHHADRKGCREDNQADR